MHPSSSPPYPSPTIPRGAEAVGLDGRIRNVYVAPPFRRNGLARRLTLVAVERARELGVGRLALGASAMGRSVYESLGFVAKPEEMVYAPFERA